MPSYGDYKREIKTIADLKYLLHELTVVHGMPDDCEIDFSTGMPFGPDIKIFAGGDISYSSNAAMIDAELVD